LKGEQVAIFAEKMKGALARKEAQKKVMPVQNEKKIPPGTKTETCIGEVLLKTGRVSDKHYRNHEGDPRKFF